MTSPGSRSRSVAVAAGTFLLAMGVVSRPALAAGTPSIEAQLTTDTLSLGEQTTFSLVIQNAEGSQVTLPNFGELLVGEPQRSSQSSIMISGGQMQTTTSIVYTWVIEAPREGKFTIGPAKVTFKGQAYQSQPVQVTCSGQAAPAPPPKQRQQQRNPFSFFDPFDSNDDSFPGFQHSRRGDTDIYLRAVTDKSEVYLGEQVTLTLYAYSSNMITTVQNLSMPKLDGFWAEDIEAPTELRREQKVVNGVGYNVYMLRKRAIFPLRAGDLTIDGMEADIGEGIPMFPSAQPDTVKRKSQPVKLTVKPLPAGAPAGFEPGSVGTFQLIAQASPQTTPLGQPIQLKIVLEGIGNIKNIQVPKPQLPDGLKTYDPTVTEKIRPAAGRYGGTRTIEWVVIPNRTGDFTIPPIELPFFDPSRGAYATARTNPITLHVSPGDVPSASTGGGPVAAPQASNILSGGLRPTRIVAEVAPSSPPLWKRTMFWPLTGAPIAAWLFIFGGSLFTNSMRRRDPKKLKERRAHSEASKRLKTARTLLEKNDSVGFHAEVTRSLQQFIEDRIGVVATGLTREELGKTLIEKGHTPGLVRSLIHIFERCETARFSPQGGTSAEMEKLFGEASAALDALGGRAP